jgi:hypothetical protein
VRLRHDAGVHKHYQHDGGSDIIVVDNHSALSTESNHDLWASWAGRARILIMCLRDDTAVHDYRNGDHMDHGLRLSVGLHEHLHRVGPEPTCVPTMRLRPGDRASLSASATGSVSFTTTGVSFATAAAVARIWDDVNA